MLKPLKASDVIAAYKDTGSMRGAAQKLGRSWQTIAKHLVSNGIYPTETCAEIHRLLSAGWTRAEICEELDISAKTYAAFTPYQKGSYCAAQKTVNAQRIARCRANKGGMPNAKKPR